MSRAQKLIAICIAFVMTLSLVTGCSGQKNQKPDGSNDAAVKTTGDDKTPKEDTKNDSGTPDKTFAGLKFTPGDYDLGGKEIVFSAWTVVAEKGVNAVWDRMLKQREKTEKKYNVKIKEVIPSGIDKFVEEAVAKYSAGLKFADIIFAPSMEALKLLKVKGMIQPLDDYIDYSEESYKLTGAYSQFIDGKHYSMARTDMEVGNIVYYNTEMLKREGCEDIFELYQRGEWNWDKLLEIAKKLTKGDEQKGIGGSFIVDSILASNGVKIVDIDAKNGKFVSGLFTPAGEKSLDFLRDLIYTNKVIDGWYGGHNSILNMKAGTTAMVLAPPYYGEHFIKAGLPIKTAPLPVGPDMQGPVNMLSFSGWNMLSSISDFTPEEAISVFLDAGRNDPNDPDIYIPDTKEDQLEAWTIRTVDQSNNWATEEEAKFWFDFTRDAKTINMLDNSPTGTQTLLKQKVVDPIEKGEEPRSCLEAIRPIIEEDLKNMMPK